MMPTSRGRSFRPWKLVSTGAKGGLDNCRYGPNTTAHIRSKWPKLKRALPRKVVYRNLDGVSWDISQSVTSPPLPADDHTALDLTRPFTDAAEPKMGFAIKVTSLQERGVFSGTFSRSADAKVPWRGKSIGMTHTPPEVVVAPPQPMNESVRLVLELTPLRADGKGGVDDMAQVGSNALFGEVSSRCWTRSRRREKEGGGREGGE